MNPSSRESDRRSFLDLSFRWLLRCTMGVDED